MYCLMNEEDKDLFWINTIEKIFEYLSPKMQSDEEKIKQYIDLLRSSDIKSYKQKVRASYEAWQNE